MSESLAAAAKKGGGRLTLFGILTIIVGVLAMAAPGVTGLSITILVGSLMLVAGIFRLIWAFRAESFGQGLFKFLIGGITLVAGILVLANPILGLTTLTLLLAAYFVVDGIFEILGAFQVKPATGWGWLLFGGIVSLLLGVMIWRQYPLSGVWAIGILVGVKLLMAGLGMVMLGTTARSLGKAAGA